jgi:hypothetical protein
MSFIMDVLKFLEHFLPLFYTDFLSLSDVKVRASESTNYSSSYRGLLSVNVYTDVTK